MKRLLILLCAFFVLSLSGCGDNAARLFDTAKFEELQNNKEHAVQLYEEILKKYPDSDYARRAQERLSQIKPAQK